MTHEQVPDKVLDQARHLGALFRAERLSMLLLESLRNAVQPPGARTHVRRVPGLELEDWVRVR